MPQRSYYLGIFRKDRDRALELYEPPQETSWGDTIPGEFNKVACRHPWLKDLPRRNPFKLWLVRDRTSPFTFTTRDDPFYPHITWLAIEKVWIVKNRSGMEAELNDELGDVLHRKRLPRNVPFALEYEPWPIEKLKLR